MKHWKLVVLLLSLIGILAVPAVFAGAPTGAGPYDPLMVTGNWQTIQPNQSLWFYFDYPGNKSKIEAALDANGASGMQMAIFTPQQAAAWMNDSATKPVAVGSKSNAGTSMAIHDLYWLGGFNIPGRFFVAVTSNNAGTVSFRLTVTGENVALAPTVTPTPFPTNPFATPVPVGKIEGRLVFQESSGGNIYTVNGDGTNIKRVTYGLDPAFSPDGKQIAFARWDNPAGVYLINVDGANERLLFAAQKALSPQWSFDSKRIVFTRQQGGPLDDREICFYGMCFTIMADPHWKLGVVDVASSAITDPSGSLHSFSPTWFTNNQTFAFADAQFGILSTDTSGAAAKNLYTQNPAIQGTIVSPDGSKIAFAVRQHDHWEINVMNADGGNVVPITSGDPLSFQVVNNVAPMWSPDSQQVLFLSDRNGKWEFFVANLDGTGLHQVLKNLTDTTPIRFNYSNERVIDWIK